MQRFPPWVKCVSPAACAPADQIEPRGEGIAGLIQAISTAPRFERDCQYAISARIYGSLSSCQVCRPRSEVITARSSGALSKWSSRHAVKRCQFRSATEKTRATEDRRRVQARSAEGRSARDSRGSGTCITDHAAASWEKRRSIGGVRKEAVRWPLFPPRGSGGLKAGRETIISSGRARHLTGH